MAALTIRSPADLDNYFARPLPRCLPAPRRFYDDAADIAYLSRTRGVSELARQRHAAAECALDADTGEPLPIDILLAEPLPVVHAHADEQESIAFGNYIDFLRSL